MMKGPSAWLALGWPVERLGPVKRSSSLDLDASLWKWKGIVWAKTVSLFLTAMSTRTDTRTLLTWDDDKVSWRQQTGHTPCAERP